MCTVSSAIGPCHQVLTGNQDNDNSLHCSLGFLSLLCPTYILRVGVPYLALGFFFVDLWFLERSLSYIQRELHLNICVWGVVINSRLPSVFFFSNILMLVISFLIPSFSLPSCLGREIHE